MSKNICFKCQKDNLKTKQISKCEICNNLLCNKCHKIHNKIKICYIDCHRCQSTKKNDLLKGILKCDTCNKLFCNQCYKKHDKFNECFCDVRPVCYVCGDIETAAYCYNLHKCICMYCI